MTDIPSTKSSGRFWAWVPAGLLGSMLLGLGTLAYIAIDDPSFALEPNYYDKAVHWDRAQAEARASQALGYRLELGGPLLRAADGSVEVELTLVDRAGAAVTGADVQVDMFANANAKRIERLSLREVAPGRYRATLRDATLGLWELRCAASQGGQRYQQTLRHDIGKGSAA